MNHRRICHRLLSTGHRIFSRSKDKREAVLYNHDENDKNIKEPRITLVGAGPGDADLITVKGIKALQTADVVLYDALVNEELLDYAPENATKVYVGKRSGDHSFSQDNINNLMVDYAKNYGHVVRLKRRRSVCVWPRV
jgi:hypothetical protein